MPNAPVRFIGLHHIAFFRAAFELDLTLEEIALRYLETGRELPAAKRTLKMIESALTMAAKRKRKHGQALLLRVPRARFRESAPDDHALLLGQHFETWCAQIDPDEHFSYAEKEEMYVAEFKPQKTAQSVASISYERRLERNARLLKRRTEIINQLSIDIVVPPRLEDNIDGWFDQRIANRLTIENITTLADLILLMNSKGNLWYVPFKGLGKTAAEKIKTFLLSSDLGDMLTEYALTPLTHFRKHIINNALQNKSAEVDSTSIPKVLPLEQLQHVSFELSGYEGKNRAPLNLKQIPATDDLTAIRQWLEMYEGNTFISYRKEVERLLLWCLVVKKQAFSSLSVVETKEFLNFLKDPTPIEQWVADKKFERFHPSWRPFVRKKIATDIYQSGLSESGAAYTKTVLKGMCGWLVDQCYLQSNPFIGLPRLQRRVSSPTDKTFSIDHWKLIQQYVYGLADTEANIRKRFLVLFAYATGLRAHEIAKANVNDFYRQHYPDGSRKLFLKVIGKGKRERDVPIVSKIPIILDTYLATRSTSLDVVMNTNTSLPLIASLEDKTQAIGVRRILVLLKEICDEAATSIDHSDPESARLLRSISTHWFRHSYATHAIYRNVPALSLRDNLGHASISTTNLYLHTNKSARHDETENFLSDL